MAPYLDAGDERLASLAGPPGPAPSLQQALLAHVPPRTVADAEPAPIRFVPMPLRLQQLVGTQPVWVSGLTVTEVVPGLDPQLLREVARTGRPEITAEAVLVRADGSDDEGTYVLVLPSPGAVPATRVPADPVPADHVPADPVRAERVPAAPGPGEPAADPAAATEPLFELAFSGAPIGMAVTCGGRVLVRANQSLASLLGRDPAELTGVSLDTISAVEDVLGDEPGILAPGPGGRATGERRGVAVATRARPFVHSAGRIVWLRVSGAEVTCGPVRVTVSHFVDVTAERRVARQMTHAATHDELTGLPNRTWLLSALQTAINDVSPTALAIGGHAPAILFVDLDDFKIVNDSLGHDAGDRLLRQIAQRLRRTVRPEDAVARFGGDELVILCRDLPDGAAADQLCQRLLATIAEPVELDGRPIAVGASIGVAHADPTSTPQSLLRDADSAMYAAKRAGRNRYVVSDDLLRGFALAALTEESELRAALDGRELEVHVTPVRRLSTLRISAVDAALRWRHPVRGLLEPGYCVGLAARTGMSRDLGEFLLRRACEGLPTWREQCDEDRLRVTVALTAEHLEHADVVADVRHALQRHRTDPGSLIIDVPERALVNDSAAVVANLRALDAEGVRLALGNFGSGYSALALLRRLPVSSIRLDRLFLAGAEDGTRDAVLLAAIASMGSALGLPVQASGADTAAQVRAARVAGCTYASGTILGEGSERASWTQPPEEPVTETNVVPLTRRGSRRS